MDECLERAFAGKKPLAKKWKSIIEDGVLYLYHYHHLVLVYDLEREITYHQWYEKPTDKRGLDAAKEWLLENKGLKVA